MPDRTGECGIALQRGRLPGTIGYPSPAEARAFPSLGGAPLIRKLPALLIALALLAAIPGIVVARADHATLIDVHAIYVNKAKPTPAANCSNDLVPATALSR